MDALLALADEAGSIHAREEGIAAYDSGDNYGIACAVEYAVDAIFNNVSGVKN